MDRHSGQPITEELNRKTDQIVQPILRGTCFYAGVRTPQPILQPRDLTSLSTEAGPTDTLRDLTRMGFGSGALISGALKQIIVQAAIRMAQEMFISVGQPIQQQGSAHPVRTSRTLDRPPAPMRSWPNSMPREYKSGVPITAVLFMKPDTPVKPIRMAMLSCAGCPGQPTMFRLRVPTRRFPEV